VVDDQLRVRGMQSLRVADASIMPGTPSANTDTTMGLGHDPRPAAAGAVGHRRLNDRAG
jgi:hypothetical protein